MSDYENQRKIRNTLVDPGAQIRFAVPLIAVLFLCSALFAIILWRFQKIVEASVGMPLLEANRILLLNEVGSMLVSTSGIGLLLISLTAFYLWAVYSHRIFGPTIPILRMIHSLREGNYSHRIHLRKHGELKAIADALNEYAEAKEAQAKKNLR